MNAPIHRELPAGLLDSTAALAHATEQWDRDIVKQLTDYIAIPAKSPGFDKDWVRHGHLETVLRNAAAWIEAQKVEGLTLEPRERQRPRRSASVEAPTSSPERLSSGRHTRMELHRRPNDKGRKVRVRHALWGGDPHPRPI